MAKPILSMTDVRNIEKTLSSWNGKLTWDLLVVSVKDKFNINTTRQTLNTYGSIKAGFTDAKRRLRGVPKSVTTNPNITLKQAELVTRIEGLQRDNEQLEKQLSYLKGLLHVINIEASEKNPLLNEVLASVKRNYIN
ncbi:hypothetical protein [Motilimonas sp. E26]|uniref:hypothetical protein n=1 Tax=Motilimonas sp. E26 TaxID=2865674 RepID=UPI001E3FDD62|nr:hypothetical protein [Motilimonas sp. E26]MCE0558262.1 hypothetical protein [Motilimonas sp. E26]